MVNRGDSGRSRSRSRERNDMRGRSRSRRKPSRKQSRSGSRGSRESSRSLTERFTNYLSDGLVRRRFVRSDRVVCNIGGTIGWAPGTVQAVDEEDPVRKGTTLPYVVKIDSPIGRLISVPYDSNELCRAEICFDEARTGGGDFALKCAPKRVSRFAPRRFAVGERVCCAVEDATDHFTDWAAGTVVAVDHTLEPDAPRSLPYRVRLDAGRTVLVHRDHHALVRDLKYQEAGSRQAPDGTRHLVKFAKRKVGDAWEIFDHHTRKLRSCYHNDSSDEDEEMDIAK